MKMERVGVRPHLNPVALIVGFTGPHLAHNQRTPPLKNGGVFMEAEK
jgi:hypothetical protein